MLLAGLNWKQWGLEFFSNKWFWGVVYFFLACILALLKDLRALAKPSQMGNFFIITVSIIVIMCEQSSQLIHSYGICSFGLHIDTKNLMWTTPLAFRSRLLFTRNRRDRTHLLRTSAYPHSPLEYNEETRTVFQGSCHFCCHCCVSVHVLGSLRSYVIQQSSRWN